MIFPLRKTAAFSVCLGVALLTAAGASAATAGPRKIDDCESIQAADAYNQCLASFGPVAKDRAMQNEPAQASAAPVKASRGGKKYSPYSLHSYRKAASHAQKSGSRKRQVFSVAPRSSRYR